MITISRVSSESGYVDPHAIKKAITRETRLVAMTHASNVLGTVQPIEAIAAIVREAGALFLVDAAQTAGVVPIDSEDDADRLAGVPGPQVALWTDRDRGVYVGPRTDSLIRHWREGGTGGDSASPTQPAELPYLLEGGTPNVLGVAGLAAGIAWVAERSPEQLRREEVALLEHVVDWAEAMGEWSVAGRWDPARHVAPLSLIVPDSLAPQEIGAILDTSFEIAVRPGLHCAPYIHRAIGTFPNGTLRLSPGAFPTADDIQMFLDALSQITAAAAI